MAGRNGARDFRGEARSRNTARRAFVRRLHTLLRGCRLQLVRQTGQLHCRCVDRQYAVVHCCSIAFNFVLWLCSVAGWMVLDKDDPSHVIQRSTGANELHGLHSTRLLSQYSHPLRAGIINPDSLSFPRLPTWHTTLPSTTTLTNATSVHCSALDGAIFSIRIFV